MVFQPYLPGPLQEKGDALHAMEIGLSLEKLNFQKLRDLHEVADKSNDAQMADFVEGMLAEQVTTAVKCTSTQTCLSGRLKGGHAGRARCCCLAPCGPLRRQNCMLWRAC